MMRVDKGNRLDVRGIAAYYADEICSMDNISVDGLFHYTSKMSYLSDGDKAERTWKGICYHLDGWGIDLSGAKILDVGCGVGYTSIYFAAAGAKKVIGLDLRESKIEAFRAYTARLPEDIARRIEIVRSGIADLDCDESFGLIFAQEAISHIVDDCLLERLYSMLRRNGLLYIKDGNNELCRGYRKKLYNYWDRVENGPKGKCTPHDVEFVYRELREKLVAGWYGDVLDEDEIRMLSKDTAYLFGENLKKACDDYVRYGRRPAHEYTYATPPIHPEYGYYNEKLFNPYHLRSELMEKGFRECRLYGPSGYSRGDITRRVFNMLPLRLKYYLCPSFVVIAKK